MTHELKTWPEPFAAIVDGRKTFEVRKADRPFAVGDTLHLREWNPDGSGYTGQWTNVLVTYLVPGGAWGLPSDLCVMGFSRAAPPVPREVEEALRDLADAVGDTWLSARTNDDTPPGWYLVDSGPMLRAHDAWRAALRLLGGADGDPPCGGSRCWKAPDGTWIHSSKSYGSCDVRGGADGKETT